MVRGRKCRHDRAPSPAPSASSETARHAQETRQLTIWHRLVRAQVDRPIILALTAAPGGARVFVIFLIAIETLEYAQSYIRIDIRRACRSYSCRNLVWQPSNSTVIDHSSFGVECLPLWQGRYSKALKRNYDWAALGPERPGKSHHGLYDP